MINFFNFFLITFFLVNHQFQQVDLNTKFNTEQLIVVTTDTWDAINGSMSVYQYSGKNWLPVINNVSIVVGKNGMAWAKSLHKPGNANVRQKIEGDGNAPAGIFYLNGLFGYESLETKMNFLKVDTKTFCVDDSQSKYYNQIVKTDTINKDWSSAETMRMKTDVYKFGIFVDYNVDPAIPNKGSCIFMHIWSGKNKPTAGCTAMKEPDLLNLIKFLDKRKNPILIQVPQNEYLKLKSIYRLP